MTSTTLVRSNSICQTSSLSKNRMPSPSSTLLEGRNGGVGLYALARCPSDTGSPRAAGSGRGGCWRGSADSDSIMALGLLGASEDNEKRTKMGVLKNLVCSPQCNSNPEER